ncbi:MAG: sodium:proton antiporter [Gammaproteobacteria bacterium]|nr:sodium:proton antiporter [Gammaproteobacteria bacterium]MDH5630806.1 sodium:proton antiporter [Gammaproteobacteria bacterium]
MEWIKVLPPLVAIFMVVWKKDVILALLLAIFASEFLLLLSPETAADQSGAISAVFLGMLQTLERIVEVFTDAGNTRILVFSAIIGSLLAYMRVSGGVHGLVNNIVNKGYAKSPRQVTLLTSFTGVVVFVESNLSVLTAGILSRGLFDKFKLSRAKLAYIIDSTSAPICILILLNAWGAYVLALMNSYEFEQTAAEIVWGTIPFNFYALVTLVIVFYTAFTNKYFGPLARSEFKPVEHLDEAPEEEHGQARYMLIPLATMVLGMVGFMLWTGDGDIAKGSGSKSVLYATSLACLVAYLMMITGKKFTHKQLVKIGFDGLSELLPLVSILLLSLALGASLKVLGTGIYISQLVGDYLPLILITPMIFVVGALISFSTGTSWGTFAILIPIAVPIIQSLGMPPSLVLAAVLGGGVFGDHCSPISDTTAVSSIASGCDLLEHVRTQLPYALFVGAITIVMYLIAGMVML